MAITQNRTLNFYGYAYGASEVALTATINGQSVFSGNIPTIDAPFPPPPYEMSQEQVLFSITNSTLFPTNFSGAYPMSVTVTAGEGVVFGKIEANYMGNTKYGAENIANITMTNASIVNNVLTINGAITLGARNIVLGPTERISGDGVPDDIFIQSGSGTVWNITPSSTVITNQTLTATGFPTFSGNDTVFLPVYQGTPTNSDGSPDVRSNVMIDGVLQKNTNPPSLVASTGSWTWPVEVGSTITYNLNVSEGDCAQS